MRLKLGNEITVCDAHGYDFKCKITQIISDEVVAQIIEGCPTASEPHTKIKLFQALPKGDKLDFIIQKAVELGIDEIIPVITNRCVSRPDEKSMEKKLARLQRISYEAAKQCGRGKIPCVSPLANFEQAVEMMKTGGTAILFYENASEPLKSILRTRPVNVSIMIGPEGGFEDYEVDYAYKRGVYIASLGSRILRCETAPICAMSNILYELEP